MNKSDLTEQLASKMKIPVRDAASIVDTVLKMMTDALVRGDNVEIRGVGSFTVKEYQAYTGRNPKTGERIKVEPKKLPFFRVGSELNERLGGGIPMASVLGFES
jgi:integration host factor subunit beta